MEPKEWAGTIVFALIMLMSNVAGIGGGGVAVPIAMYSFELDLKDAIALSSFCIMVGTITRLVVNFSERHP